MSTDIAELVSDNLDVWIGAVEQKASAGRGGGRRVGFYGIERLRALILNLAVQGKLVPQQAEDGRAADLFEAIEDEKKRQFKAGVVKRMAQVATPANWPFRVPDSWVWSQIGTITNYGDTEKADPGSVDDDTWVLELEDVEKGSSRLLERVRHSSRKFQSQKNRFRPGDVIYGKLRPYLDKVLIADEVGVCTTEMVPMRGYYGLEPTYLRWYLKSPFFIGFADGSTHGMNLPRVGTDKARAAPIALPPLAEQRRIVAKVDELLALCDALEAQSASALEAHQNLVETLLATLVDATDSADLARQWARLESHFDTLFTTDASVEALRQIVLELAVRGRLVTQDPADEPAIELVRKWKKAKHKALERGGDRRVKSAPQPTNAPFPIPGHWAIQSFENVFLFVDYRGNTPPKTTAGIPLITAKNVRMGYLAREPREYISDVTFGTWMTRGFPEAGDLFFTTEAPLGNICINDIEEPFAIAQRLICLKPYGVTNTRFYMMTVMSRSMQRVLDDNATGVTARGIKAAKLKSIALPVPPEEEQQRIVDKVDELMALCDALKARLADASQSRKYLADASIERTAA